MRAPMMTGRVVDSYTNIATVKLFSHAGARRPCAARRWTPSCRPSTGRRG